jgi:HEPN domain-containing protein
MKYPSATASWFTKAEDDLRWTESNLREAVYYGACFTAQQAVEKALKAYLLSQGKILRKIHTIDAILEECIACDASFESLHETILPLVDYYIQTRYPDASDFISYTKEKAEDAYARAKETLLFVKSKLPASL